MNSDAIHSTTSRPVYLADKLYGAYGESSGVPLSSSSAAVTYGFTGAEYDVESGLYYMRARMYDPVTGRWTTRDPIGFEGGDTNLYTYAKQNPTNFIDPSGLIINDPDHVIPDWIRDTELYRDLNRSLAIINIPSILMVIEK